MVDIAEYGVAVFGKGIGAVTADLTKLSGAADKTETALDGVSRSSDSP